MKKGHEVELPSFGLEVQTAKNMTYRDKGHDTKT